MKHGISTKFGHKATKVFSSHNPIYWFEFPNGYTASVFRETLTKDDRYELAVIRGGRPVYDTPITGDVIRWATPEEIRNLISRVAKLQPAR